ncbi:MAG: YjfK family protein [Rhodospirillales bacterium]|nr:YjfK family protein [Rhodospirillales bacterium]
MFGGAMKSLFRSGVRDLKDKFSKADESDAFPTPLGLRIGAAVDIDTLPLRMNAEQIHVRLPEETMLIEAQGYVELGDASYAHRFYNANDTMIQVLTIGGTEDRHIEEITLFVPYKSYYPGSEGEWAQWTAAGGKIGAPSFVLDDGTEFTRLWFDATDGYAEPVEFTESVYEDPESDEHEDVFYKTMLYGRNLEADKKNEYLLASVEDYGNERTVELMVGVDLEIANLNVI